MTILRTSRLVLRPPGPDDVAPLAALLSEPAVAEHWPDYDADRVRAELVEPQDDVTVFVITEGGVPIGALQIAEETDPQYRHAGIDLFLGTAAQGAGRGPEAIRAVVEHLFGTLGHHRLVIDPAAANTRAVRAYGRVGFRPVGVLRRYERGADGTWHDGLLMELLAEDYPPRSHDTELPVAHRTAACSCGQLRIEVAGEPRGVGVCHCLACQRRTGSAFAALASFAAPWTVTGIATEYVRQGDAGARFRFRFCPVCGTTVFHTEEGCEGSVGVAVGAFADPSFPAPTVSVYDCRRHPWVGLPPGITAFDRDPP